MAKKIDSLSVKIISLLVLISLTVVMLLLTCINFIFTKYYSKTSMNYLFNICASTANSLSVSANDGTGRTNNKIKYILQNINAEDMDTLQVGLIDETGKYIYFTESSEEGRYVTENETIEKNIELLRNKEYFKSNVTEGKVNNKKYFIAYTKTYNDNLLFLQVEKREVLKPIREVIIICFIVAIIAVIVCIFAGLIFVDKISNNEKNIKNELKLEKENAEKANSAKSDFLASMSHEIRTPINAVLGMNEMILRESKEPNINEYANNIKTAGYTLLSLINDILDFSKISSGKLSLVESEYETRSIFNDIIMMFDMKLKSKNLKFKIDIDNTFPEKLYGDEIRIKQVLTNILSNAYKYTNDGFVALSVKVLSTNEGYISYRIAVQDTGIGIKEEDLNKLFSSFQRLDEKKNKNIEGTGLGMSITKQILELMGSKLQVVSEYGKGSVFSFILNQKIIDPKPIGDINTVIRTKDGTENYKEKFVAPNAHILLVDDVEMNLKVATNLMKKLNMKIDTALSGKEAIDLCKNNQYDLILMDYMMPEMDGIEASKKIREDIYGYTYTPIIALTADAVVGAKTKFVDAGMNDYITKPINIYKLESSLLKWLPKEKIEKINDDFETKERNTQIIYSSSNNYLPNVTSPSFESSCEIDNIKKEIEDNIPFIDGINSRKAINLLGSLELFEESLKMYHDSIDKKSKMIQDYEANEDIENFIIQVHALKSMSRSIACEEIGVLAEELEMAGKANNLKLIHEKTPELLIKYREYKNKLIAYASNPEESIGNYIEFNDMKIKLDELSDYINSFDIDNAEKWIKEINPIYFENYSELKEIKNCIELIRFNECKDAINRLLIKIDNEDK